MIGADASGPAIPVESPHAATATRPAVPNFRILLSNVPYPLIIASVGMTKSFSCARLRECLPGPPCVIDYRRFFRGDVFRLMTAPNLSMGRNGALLGVDPLQHASALWTARNCQL